MFIVICLLQTVRMLIFLGRSMTWYGVLPDQLHYTRYDTCLQTEQKKRNEGFDSKSEQHAQRSFKNVILTLKLMDFL